MSFFQKTLHKDVGRVAVVGALSQMNEGMVILHGTPCGAMEDYRPGESRSRNLDVSSHPINLCKSYLRTVFRILCPVSCVLYSRLATHFFRVRFGYCGIYCVLRPHPDVLSRERRFSGVFAVSETPTGTESLRPRAGGIVK
jgi:hypothetical protein